ncbi:MAG: RDD family protein [bacterium]|nr:RDD family protein [bacterium]
MEKTSETENNKINYASEAKRLLNYVLDNIILVVIMSILCSILGAAIGSWVSVLNMPESFVYSFLFKLFSFTIGFTISGFIYYFYYFIFESKFQRTPAKFITKTKVLDMNGGKPTKSQIIIRTLIRFIPFEAWSGFGKGEKGWYGWHDRWSQTMVVNSSSESDKNV